jgi:hypothetical protein
MPIVILTIFTLLYLTFYLHDRCKIQGTVDETLFLAGLSLKYEADLTAVGLDSERIKKRGVFDQLLRDRPKAEQELKTYLRQRLAEGLFLYQITDIEAEFRNSKLEISVETISRISIPWVELFFEDYSHSVISEEHPIHDPAETIRVCEVALDTASQVKGVEELKNSIEKVISDASNN